ncbi:hypothetical protein M404DRAFT_95704, partial [Pisolithus tinctorius Marx 270]
TNHLIKWCKTHEAAHKKLFSDSMQDAQEEGRSKQQLCHRKNDIYVEIAKVIFSVGDESVKIHALAQDNLVVLMCTFLPSPPLYFSVFTYRVCSLKQKYQKSITLLGQTGAGWTYNNLVSNTSTKHTVRDKSKEFPWWGDLHGWWHTNPLYNSMWSGADSGQNFAACAARL